MITRSLRIAVSVSVAVAGLAAASPAQAPTVRAVFFYSPTCPHCHTVIRQDLPGIFERFGGTARVWFDPSRPVEERVFFLIFNGELEILLVNVALPEGAELYRASTEAFHIPPDREGVPRLIIQDSVLVGSYEIPTYLPDLVGAGRATGGIDWPGIDGLDMVLASIPGQSLAAVPRQDRDSAAVAEPADTAAAPSSGDGTAPNSREAAANSARPVRPPPVESLDTTAPSETAPAEKAAAASAEAPAPGSDTLAAVDGGTDAALIDGAAEAPAATGGAEFNVIPAALPSMMQLYAQDPVGNGLSVVVLLVMLVSLGAVWPLARAPERSARPGPLVPAVAMLGAVVAVYLTYVETSGGVAVCGPVGDCNAVQSSEYALLFGAIHVGTLGLAGYIAIVITWGVSRLDSTAAEWASLALLAMAVVGTLFSLYLTFLEPFVIGATCLWCLSSALAMTALLWLSARPGVAAWQRIRTA